MCGVGFTCGAFTGKSSFSESSHERNAVMSSQQRKVRLQVCWVPSVKWLHLPEPWPSCLQDGGCGSSFLKRFLLMIRWWLT